jgi:hypothetical protein
MCELDNRRLGNVERAAAKCIAVPVLDSSLDVPDAISNSGSNVYQHRREAGLTAAASMPRMTYSRPTTE